MADAIIAPCLHLIARQAAKRAGLTYYFTGKPCLRGHISLRQTSTGQCRICKDEWADDPEHRARKNAQERAAKKSGRRNTDHRQQYLKHRESRLAYMREYRAANRDRFTAWMAAWRAANPERAKATRRVAQAKRRAAHSAPAPEISSWLASVPKVCHWCGVKCADDFHMDHYQPLALGGAHAVSNLVIACRKCNLSKSAKDPYAFAASRGRLF